MVSGDLVSRMPHVEIGMWSSAHSQTVKYGRFETSKIESKANENDWHERLNLIANVSTFFICVVIVIQFWKLEPTYNVYFTPFFYLAAF